MERDDVQGEIVRAVELLLGLLGLLGLQVGVGVDVGGGKGAKLRVNLLFRGKKNLQVVLRGYEFVIVVRLI